MTLKGKAKTDYQRDYMRRWRAGQKATPKSSAKNVAAAEARIRELEAELARRDRDQQVARSSHRAEPKFGSLEFKLQGEIRMLKSDIAKLKMALQEEPDAAKLRKKVVDQQVEMTSLRRVMRKIAKERDEYQARTRPKYREARQLFVPKNIKLIIKALHSDRAKNVSAAELAEAERVAIAFLPLFDEAS